MIRFEAVSKTFPGAARPSVDRIDLAVEAGETCVLIGPSGCGKTTTLRMANRLIEPDSGSIRIDGRNVLDGDPVALRRGIGYVIQGTGLFPHRTVGENVGTVPALLGWPRTRIRERVDAMLDLVGLDPDSFRDRRPASLSGGQRQRAGVARALAADPPILLMDEPFGAVDPLVRARLQVEIRALLRRLGKSVMLVTHDIDEAVRMGDRVALMREGRIVQHDTPDRLLAAPADPFVADFVGAERGLRRLSLVTAGAACRPGPAAPGLPSVAADTSLTVALSVMLAAGAEAVAVVDGSGQTAGTLSFADLRARAALPDQAGTGDPVQAGTGDPVVVSRAR